MLQTKHASKLILLASTAFLFGCNQESETASTKNTSSSHDISNATSVAEDLTTPQTASSELQQSSSAISICLACHSMSDPSKGKSIRLGGPSLWGIVDRKVGSISGYPYSESMKKSDISWTQENLASFIESPQDMFPGNNMAFLGVPNEEDRSEILNYLNTLK